MARDWSNGSVVKPPESQWIIPRKTVPARSSAEQPGRNISLRNRFQTLGEHPDRQGVSRSNHHRRRKRAAGVKRQVRRSNPRSDEEKRKWRSERSEEAVVKRRDNERNKDFNDVKRVALIIRFCNVVLLPPLWGRRR